MLSQIIYYFPFSVIQHTFSARATLGFECIRTRMSARKKRNTTFPLVKYKAKFGTRVNQNALDTLKSCRKNTRPSPAGAYLDQTSCYGYITSHNSVNLKQISLAIILGDFLTESLTSSKSHKDPIKSKGLEAFSP